MLDSCGWPIAGGESSTPVVGDRSTVRRSLFRGVFEVSQVAVRRSYPAVAWVKAQGIAATFQTLRGSHILAMRSGLSGCARSLVRLSGGMLGKPREPGVDAAVYYGVVCPCCRLIRPVRWGRCRWGGLPVAVVPCCFLSWFGASPGVQRCFAASFGRGIK